MITAVDVEAVRREFPAVRDCIFLQHGGSSPLPVRAAAAAAEAARRQSEEPPAAWSEAYSRDVRELKSALGRIVGADPLDIALTRATAHGLSLLATGLDWRAGDNLVVPQYEFPTNVFPWQALAARGVEMRTAAPADGRITWRELEPHVDGRTRVIALSFVHFWNGYRVDLAAVAGECRSRGILLAVDGIQGAGAVALDLTAAQVDLFAAGGYKWLLGPIGIGFCHVAPALAGRLTPPLIGSGTPDDPGTALEPRFGLGTRARRFEESAASWLDVAAFRAAVGLVEEVGVAQIEARILELTRHAGGLLLRAGCQLAPPWPRTDLESSGIIAFRPPREDPAACVDRLKEAGIHVRNVSGRYVRLSIHFYNTEAELERAVEAVAAG